MLITSNEANKLLKSYQTEYDRSVRLEAQVYKYTAATTENLDDAAPEYDFTATQTAQVELLQKIRALKHKINVFNTTTIIPDFNITIDEALVLLPQLTSLVNKYKEYASRLPKERVSAGGGYFGKNTSAVIEYTYANYEIAEAEVAYKEAADRLSKLQTALDKCNNTITFEV